MSAEFILRIVGMVIFAIFGVQLGVNSSGALNLPAESVGLIFGLVGALAGLVITPWITTRPVRTAQRMLLTTPTGTVVMTFIGLVVGLVPALLLAYPISLLPGVVGSFIPLLISTMFAYLGMTIFAVRASDIMNLIQNIQRGGRIDASAGSRTRILLDTSVIIDGRILDIAQSGFLNWTLVVPRFVLEELQHIADSADMMRRNRGKRGLEVLRELKRMDFPPFEIVDDDVPNIEEVDHKLVMLGRQTDAPIMTNDFNLNQIAKLQGVVVLNINMLANSVRAEYIPGEEITVKVIQEGKEHDQGVGYLQDGTMVVVENGRRYLDRTIRVEITRLISREAGKMYFARPADDQG